MPDYFFDTSVLAAYFADEDSRSVDLVEDVLSGRATAAVSAITVAELWSLPDMAREDVQRQREAVVQLTQIVPIDHAIAVRGGVVRRTYNLRLPDALIVASCQITGGRFFSKDIHFQRVLASNDVAGEVYS
jgi:predicted nucleic acid-binding protein